MKEERMVQPQEIAPEALVIVKTIRQNWDYQSSISKVQGLYISWKTISTELLQELWVAKQAITENGARIAGRTKKGQLSWSAYVKDCFGGIISQRSVDSYLARYTAAGMTKPVPTPPTSDPTKLVVKNVKRVDGRISLDLYLPEYDVTYHQSFAA
jgi:hypothetical protein